MQTIEDKLKEVLANTDFDFSELQKYEESLKEFDEMVSKGIVKRRGYTLQTVEEASYPSLTFNAICV